MLNNFFSPKSIAVIGTSRNKKKLGFLVYENIRKYGFKGKLYGVNIRGGKIPSFTVGIVETPGVRGSQTSGVRPTVKPAKTNVRKLYKNVNEIEGEVDLAVVVVPAQAVPSVIEDLGKKGINSCIIISSGFSETGAEGKRREEDIKRLAEIYGVRILGPNCLGIIDSWSKINASFAESMPDKMNISFFSQSGAICTAILDWANQNEIGFSRFISLGNKLDIDENDILAYLTQDNKTKIVLSYLESIKDGRCFMANARRLTQVKPLIIVKSGKTKRGAKTVFSHTGNIAGSDEAVNAAIRQCGGIRAESLEDLFDYAKIFAFSSEMRGNRVAVISNAGGPAVMLADSVERSRLKLADFSEKTLKILEEGLPEEASVHNPIDVMGDARSDRYELALENILKDENVDAVLVVLTPQVMTEIEKTAKLASRMKKYRKPIAACFIGGEKVEEGRKILEEKKIPSYEFPERAVKSLEALYQYHHFKNHISSETKPKYLKFNKPKAGAIIREAFQKRNSLLSDISFDVFDAYGIETVKRAFDVGLTELDSKAKEIGYPVVIKTAAEDVLHKTDIGGVIKGIRNHSELQKAYFSIRDNVRKSGFYESSELVDIYKEENKGIEIFLGAKKDSNFGPLIVFGIGGIYVEVLKDFAYRIAPITHTEAKKMISEIKSQKVLNGFRGMSEANREKIADSIVGLSWLMLDFPEIKEIDINPLKCTDKKCVAVDGRIILDL